jgi:dipeptidyl aminopeptidase/acylaminoacyl peptidase
LINYGDRLRGGIDTGGVADFVGVLGGSQAYRRDELRREYGDERDPESRDYLRRISPLSSADRISKPMLIVHGANDPFVPASQAEELVYRLRNHGASVWYLLAGDEGREFQRRPNRKALLETSAEFLTAIR